MAQNTSSGPPMEPRASDGNSGAATADMTWNPWNEGNTLGFDGGGIRGYWSLLVLRSFMLKIKEAEEAMDDDARSSFHPEHAPSAISQLTYASATHFLPCHYFDLIGGTSTGALIAIMLSMFRMTVEDCIDEYKKMGTAIFGRPRTLHAIRLPPLTRTKFSTKNLTESFESVIRRRAVNTENLTSRVRFRTEPGTCRGIVLSVTDGSSEQVISIRSYATQQVERDPFDVEWSILDAAQAATAAPLYFDRFPATARQVSQSARVPTLRNMSTFFAGRRDQPEPEGRSYLIDAGFGIDNNPCNSILQEMKKINPASRPILVSIGTARPSHPEQEGRHRTLFKTVRRAFRTLGNPEKWHDHLEARAVEDDFSYYRFNSAGGLDIEMDEWKPKGGGQKTLKRMDAHFNAWVNEPGIEDQLRSCAEQLVKVRRARVKTDRARWERYALGRYFVCDHNGCDMQEQNHRYTDRSRFEKHLREHIKDENDIEAAVRRARKDWEYRTAPASNSP